MTKPSDIILCALVDRVKLQRRLNRRLVKIEDCLLWTGARSLEGYGLMWVCGTYTTSAHRVALSLFTGKPFPYSEWPWDACHKPRPLCQYYLCCNVEHLEWGTHKNNLETVQEEMTAGYKRFLAKYYPTGDKG